MESSSKTIDAGLYLSALYGIVILRILIVYLHSLELMTGFFLTVIALAIGGAAVVAAFGTVFFFKYLSLTGAFHLDGGWESSKLLDEFINKAKQLCPGYKTAKEENDELQREADRRYREEHPVFVDWRAVQARMDATGYSGLSSHDHDDLDAVQSALGGSGRSNGV